MVWSSTLASDIFRRRNLFKARCDCGGMIGTPLSTTRFSSREPSIFLDVGEIFCSAGARSCHEQGRHQVMEIRCRNLGSCLLYHAGEMEALVQARGVEKANQGPTTSVIEHMPHSRSAKGWRNSDNGRGLLVRAMDIAWICTEVGESSYRCIQCTRRVA